MLLSTKRYIYLIIPLTILELVLGVPLFVDYLLTFNSAFPYVYGVSLIHVFCLVYISLKYTEYYSKMFHIFGILAIFTNSMLIISCITHLIAFIFGTVFLNKLRKKLRTKEKIEENKEIIKAEHDYRKELGIHREIPPEYREFLDDDDDDLL